MTRGSPTVPVALLILSLVVVVAVAVSVGTPFANLLTAPPDVSLDIDRPQEPGPNETVATVTFSHAGGDALPVENLHVVVDGERVAADENLTLSRSAPTFAVGGRIVVEQTAEHGLTGGEELALVYRRGDTTFRLRVVTVPGEGSEP